MECPVKLCFIDVLLSAGGSLQKILSRSRIGYFLSFQVCVDKQKEKNKRTENCCLSYKDPPVWGEKRFSESWFPARESHGRSSVLVVSLPCGVDKFSALKENFWCKSTSSALASHLFPQPQHRHPPSQRGPPVRWSGLQLQVEVWFERDVGGV